MWRAPDPIKVKIKIIWRAPGLYEACPTQPYKCGQCLKVKIKVDAVLTLRF